MRITIKQPLPGTVANPLIVTIAEAIRAQIERLDDTAPETYVGQTFFYVNNWQATLGKESMATTDDGWITKYCLYYSDPDLFDKIEGAIGRAVAISNLYK